MDTVATGVGVIGVNGVDFESHTRCPLRNVLRVKKCTSLPNPNYSEHVPRKIFRPNRHEFNERCRIDLTGQRNYELLHPYSSYVVYGLEQEVLMAVFMQIIAS